MEQNKTHHSRIIFIFIFIYVQFLRYFRSASRCFISSFKWVWTNSFNNINSYVYVQNSSKWQIMQIFFYSKFIREGYLSPKGLSNGQTHWHIVFWSFCRSKPEVLYNFFWFSFFLYKCYIFIRLLHVSLPNTLSIIEATTIECALFLHEWSKYCKLTRVFRAEPVYSILFIVFAFAREDTSMILGHYQQSTYNYQKHCNMTNSTQNR